MRRSTLFAALAATVALPMLATPASAQQDRGYGSGWSGDTGYQWSEDRNAMERDRARAGDYYAGRGTAPKPPRTPERYITDWDDRRGGPDARYGADWQRQGGGYDRGGYGREPYADDRWSQRTPPMRDFDRPSPPPGYADEPGYARGEYGRDVGPRYGGGADRGDYERGYRDTRGFDPYAGRPWTEADERERWHREMMARHHGPGHADRDFRRDFEQDGRRGYYQDSSYEQMPRGRQRMGGRRDRMDHVDMEEIRRAMRTIDRFDANGDGRVTQQEVDQYRSDRLREFDADGDDRLTLDEYAALWADAMRERTVRRFQRHDRDGDGLVTVDEFSAETSDMVRTHDRNRDQAIAEDDFMRPRVEAPLGGAPNEPARSRVAGDDDTSPEVGGTRPQVEAPLEGGTEEPDTAAPADEQGAADEGAGSAAEDEETLDTTTN